MTARGRALFLTALLALGAAAGSFVGASPASATAGKLGRHISKAAQSRKDAEAALADLQLRFDHLMAKEQELEARINEASRQVLQALADEHAAYERLSFAEQSLADRARAAYEFGPGAGLEAMLHAGDLSQLDRAAEYAARTIGADAESVKQLAADRAALTEKRIQAEREQSALAAQEQKMTVLLDQLQSSLDQATAAAQQTRTHLQELERQRRALQKARERQLSRQTHVALAAQDLATGSRGEWAQLFLSDEGFPTCQSNLVALVAWETQEGTDARWNPLATTLSMPGATNFNSVGVKNYVSLAQGVQASELTLTNGATTYGYGAILDALRGCADAMTTAKAINASSWCRGCTNGLYVTGLIRRVEQDYAYYAGL